MANVKFSGLPAASTLAPADIFAVVQGGTSKQSTLSNLWEATAVGNANYTILATDVMVYTTVAFTAARTWTLPSAAFYGAGRILRIVDVLGTITAANTLLIARAGSDTINGGTASITVGDAFSTVFLESDGVLRWTVATIPGIREFSAVADKTVANTLTETSLKGTIAPAGGDTFPANLLIPGKSIRIKMFGYFSTTTGSNNVTWRVKLGATTLLTSSFNSFTASLTNVPISVDLLIVCRTVGASGTVVTSGAMITGEATPKVPGLLQNTAATTIDTTVTQVLDVTGQWNVANAANTITAQIMTVETF